MIYGDNMRKNSKGEKISATTKRSNNKLSNGYFGNSEYILINEIPRKQRKTVKE